MNARYDASAIEVLSGLDPVRRRPGMYTDTSRPNHLAHEVIDNSVDEAIVGHCKRIDVTLHKDGSLEVADDGRGMPVDIHPTEKVSGVELILTRLHSGAKFSNKSYRFSGGLHGVGVSVVNALSKNLEVWVRRDGNEYNMSFRGGTRASKLEIVGKVGKNNTGTTIRFWPDARYFDSDKLSVPQLKHVLQAKAVLCPGLKIRLAIEHPRKLSSGSTRADWASTWRSPSAMPARCPWSLSPVKRKARKRKWNGRSSGLPARLFRSPNPT
jgi:topoisomerase-4 subunit B